MTENSEFPRRHIGPNGKDVSDMLEALNLPSLDALIDLAVPTNIRELSEPLTLPEALEEAEALRRLKEIAEKNEVKTSLIGLGYYDNLLPV